MSITQLDFSRALYIKLGRSGSWEKECLEKGILRFGYKETPFGAAMAGDWDAVHAFWFAERQDTGTATRDVNQIRDYFESDKETLWITFHDNKLWWCRVDSAVENHADGRGSYRHTVDGWHDTDINGHTLSSDKLSGSLLKVQRFQGTICAVKEFDYLKRKLNGQVMPEVEEAIAAENEMVRKIIPLMQHLSWQDFELLVDLVFSSSGWRRIGHLGKTQKTVDIELLLPTTGERAFVQIKSSASKDDFEDYLRRLNNSTLYNRMFFVWHTGDIGNPDIENNVVLIDPERLARMVFDSGLVAWLREKVS